MKLLKQNILRHTLVLGLTCALTLTYGTAPAAAGGGKSYHDRHSVHYHGKHYRHYKKHHKKHYKKHYNVNRHHHVYYHSYPRHRHHGHSRLFTGFVLGAVTATAAYNLSRQHNSRHDHTHSHNSASVSTTNKWVSHTPQYKQNTTRNCLQEREYTTTITVGNETVPAYGTACLQPDGSWKMGPPQPVR